MVNFRFHLVSLTAVFLALAAGIVIGAGVVDRQTVAFLEARLADVRDSRDETNRKNDEYQADLALWRRFSDESGMRMVQGALSQSRVLVIAVEGTPREPVQQLQESLRAAGATLEGTVWFTQRWRLDDEDEVGDMATAMELAPPPDGSALRAQSLGAVADGWAAGGSAVAAVLRDNGFFEFEAEPGRPTVVQAVPTSGTSVVVVQSEGAVVAPADLGLQLATLLVDRGIPVLAAQPKPSPRNEGEGTPTADTLASLVRASDVAGRVSSVDNVDDYRGRLAAVLAIADLARGKFGHYGAAPDAQRVLPEPPS